MSLFLRKRVLGVVPHALLLLAASCGGSATNDSSGAAGSEGDSATGAAESTPTSSSSRRRRMRSRPDSRGDDGSTTREVPTAGPPNITMPSDGLSRCLGSPASEPGVAQPVDAGVAQVVDAGGRPTTAQSPDAGSAGSSAGQGVDAGSSGSVVAQDAGSTRGEDDSSSEDDTGFVIAELGLPCEGNCAAEDCYVPGTGEGAICSRQCESHADCGATGVCQALGSYQEWCFLRCQADSDCTSVNPQADNPLVCLPTYHSVDPYLGSSEQGPACHSLCVQSSEP